MNKENDKMLKPQYGWVVSFFLPFTPWFAKFSVTHGVTANQVSWSSLAVFMVGLFFYFFHNDIFWFRFLATFLFCVGTFLDVLDGAVARLSKTQSKYGANLDAGIDLFRYNIFFMCVLFLFHFSTLDLVVLVAYVSLLNYSFIASFVGRHRSVAHITTNSDFEKFLPERYKKFCVKNRLLYNPFNLEDQLLFMFFVLGVLFQAEIVMLYVALFFRIINVIMVLSRKLVRRS